MGKKKKLQDIPDDSDIEDSETESKGLQILNNILNIKDTNPSEYNSIKHILYATAIFIILSLPFTDRLIELIVPIANSWLILLGIKIIVFFMFYLIISKIMV